MTEEMTPEGHETLEDAHEHGAHGAHGGGRGNKLKSIAAFVMIIFALGLAIFSAQSSDSETQALLTRMEANDKWTEFGVQSIKGTVWEMGKTVLSAFEGPAQVDTAAATKKIEAVLGRGLTASERESIGTIIVDSATAANAAKLEAAKKFAEGQIKHYEEKKGDILPEAKGLIKHSEHELVTHEKFKKAANMIQISLTLVAGVMLAAGIFWLSNIFFFSGLSLGALSILAGAVGYGWIEVPHLLAPYLIKLGIG
jgi:hypothetical protein